IRPKKGGRTRPGDGPIGGRSSPADGPGGPRVDARAPAGPPARATNTLTRVNHSGKASTPFVRVVVAPLLLSPSALANGRFPRAEKLIENPNNSNELEVAATYGLLKTDDRKNWYYVCEMAFAFQAGFTGDPLFGIMSDEALLLGTDDTLALSRDRGCDWTK